MSLSDADELKRAFDVAFAAPLETGQGATRDFLAVRIAGKSFAIALDEVAALERDKRVTPLPSARPELLGVAGMRGEIVPIYDLAAMFGETGGRERPRWIAVARHTRTLGFAFEEFEGYLREPVEHLASVQSDAPGRHIAGSLISRETRPIISMSNLIDDIESNGNSGTTEGN